MAATKATGPNKSEFIRQLLGQHPETNLKAVNTAWKKAGHKGSISNPLFYQNKPKAKGLANGAMTCKTTPKKRKARATKKHGPEKSVFVRELLGRNPEANLRAVNEAWNKAGNKGTISSTLVYLIKSKIPSAGTKRSADGAVAGKASVPKPKSASTKGKKAAPAHRTPVHTSPHVSSRSASSVAHGGLLDELEVGIDELIFELNSLGGLSEVEEALREARRLIVRHEG
jgi:hypothetical protein